MRSQYFIVFVLAVLLLPLVSAADGHLHSAWVDQNGNAINDRVITVEEGEVARLQVAVFAFGGTLLDLTSDGLQELDNDFNRDLLQRGISDTEQGPDYVRNFVLENLGQAGDSHLIRLTLRNQNGRGPAVESQLRVNVQACQDSDNDGICDNDDICPAGDDTVDTDRDGIPDACDEPELLCPDFDNDGVVDPGQDPRCGPADNCPARANPNQADVDGDGIGDACDNNDDRDQPPVLQRTPGNVVMDEDDPTIQTRVVGSDPNGDELTYLILKDCERGDIICTSQNFVLGLVGVSNIPGYTNFDSRSGVLEIDPDFETVIHPDQVRVDRLKVAVFANGQSSDEDRFTITINDVNRDPVLDPIADIVILEGQMARFNADATDPDNEDNPIDDYRLTNLNQFENAAFTAVNGRFAWIPQVGDHGQYVANVQAHDNFGGQDELNVNIIVCADADQDGVADQPCPGFDDVDQCPLDPENDADGDGVCGNEDNCPAVPNPNQADGDGNGVGDACQECADNEELVGGFCVPIPCDDADNDGVCDDVDMCPGEPDVDSDMDGFLDCVDQCPGQHDGIDMNGNGIPDCAEVQCPDADNDGQCDDVDPCPQDPNNQCQVQCPNGDFDQDGICDEADNCPVNANPDQANRDGDAFGDACDICPDDVLNQCQIQCQEGDADQDGICNNDDNCPNNVNPNQEDVDNDGIGDACDICVGPGNVDRDNDNICDAIDNCPDVANQNQEDQNNNGIGDVCEEPVLNDGPVITSRPVTQTRVGSHYEYDVDARDPQNDPLTYSLLDAPAGMSIDPNTGVITYEADDEGNYHVVVRVSDGRDSATQRYTLRVGNSFRGIEFSHIYLSEDYVAPGQSVLVEVQLDNEGYDDLEDVTVTVVIPELGVRALTSDFDLDDRSLETRATQLYIPYWAPEGEYLVRITADGQHGKNTFQEHTYRTVYVMNWR